MKVLKQGLFSLIGQIFIILLIAGVGYGVGMQAGANNEARKPGYHHDLESTLVIRSVVRIPGVLILFSDLKPVEPAPASPAPAVELSDEAVNKIVEGVVVRLPRAGGTSTSATSPASEEGTVVLPERLRYLLESPH